MNVFLGEPSDAVVSYADKRYYKHTVDAMNVDVSACYKVCEEKEATMPAEKTSSNLSATIKSIKGGYTGGDLDVPVTGSITGRDSSGFSVRGNICGDICGDVYGSVFGNVCGNVCGYIGNGGGTAVCGGVCGDIMTNNNQYAVYGTVYGDIYNYVCGYIGCGYGTAVYGGVCGNICGYVCGNICGDVYGNICGNVCGYVCGDVYSGVCGSVCGSICGWFKPENVTTSTALTLDQNSDNNALLKIDVCGKQYYIHAN